MRRILLLTILLNMVFTVNAQPDPVESLVRLNTFLKKTANLRFNVTYYYEEDDSAGVTRDTLTGVSRNKTGRNAIDLGAYKKINNEYYFVLIDTANKEMYISNPQSPVKQYTNSELLDSVFLNYYTDTLTARDSSVFTIVEFAFKQTAPYTAYQVIYNRTTLEPLSISYRMKKENAGGGGPPNPEIRMNILFANFDTKEIDESYFSASQYFTRQNGAFVLQPAYASYQLVDLTGN